MRGARLTCIQAVLSDGIIPADAGSTDMMIVNELESWDHPRGCGEHGMGKILKELETGSSPRMRGALTQRSRLADGMRIIPADAGSTGWRRSGSRPQGDHPRGCGEHT